MKNIYWVLLLPDQLLPNVLLKLRKKKERMRLQHQHLLPSGAVDKCPPYSMGDICSPEIRDKRLDIRDKSIESEAIPTTLAYGQYQNVFLSDAELAELQSDLPTLWQTYVDRLSLYMASTGKQYASHAATIRRWAAEDSQKSLLQTRNRDYSVHEGETV